ncbi:MAG: hypothetical protein WCQ96_01680 [Patescibacteria group bacterium]
MTTRREEGLFLISLEDITERKEDGQAREPLIKKAKERAAVIFYLEGEIKKTALLWIKDPKARETAKRIIGERQKEEVIEGQEELQDFLIVPCKKEEEIF